MTLCRRFTPPSTSLMLLAVLACSSCAWMGDPMGEGSEGGIRVVVENHSFSDMNVFVERDGRLFRLGTVMSKQTTPFLLTHRMMGGATEFRLRADPIGSLEEVVSETLTVRRDAVTHWMLEPRSRLSSVVIQ